jgi:hypothetical protein
MVQLADREIVQLILENGFVESAMDYVLAAEDYGLVIRALAFLIGFADDPELQIFERMCEAGVFDLCEELVMGEDRAVADVAAPLLATAERLREERSG